ncbi:hypothetical protein KL925_001814 [Ogataea polymorpha]|nr:hypothetical protein KL937_000617 [Ogataea polymorpha]KAG7891870.1 hypothetical protein KL936_001813 [Ogataea polymorpha]KAG7911717.1 hypothetical protein KL906_001038 [Ogataea polymorpha]KAG7928514.1 hypothetical protein KL925_001814 [Ogataea polymorpha]KAG7939676.1 hypothetical protein KL904_000614 [Ogataea polymorpha]
MVAVASLYAGGLGRKVHRPRDRPRSPPDVGLPQSSLRSEQQPVCDQAISPCICEDSSSLDVYLELRIQRPESLLDRNSWSN